MADVRCQCGTPAALATGADVYPHRPDLHSKRFWVCPSCPNSYVGCHPGTSDALGTPADVATRKARQTTHRWFDRIWRKGGVKRTEAYAWLRVEMGLRKADCHISMFSAEQCERAIAACRRVMPDDS